MSDELSIYDQLMFEKDFEFFVDLYEQKVKGNDSEFNRLLQLQTQPTKTRPKQMRRVPKNRQPMRQKPTN